MKKQFLLSGILLIVVASVYLFPVQAQSIQLKQDYPIGIFSQLSGESPNAGSAVLTWKPMNETGILTFELQRSTDRTHFTPILLIQPKGAIKRPNGYTYTDSNLSPDCYFYRLRTETFDGQEVYSHILQIRLTDIGTLQIQTARL